MNNIQANVLLIGYGNDLRGDDGIGPNLAQIIAGWHLPGVRSLPLHQLIPELASDIAKVGLVIFVDACPALETETVNISPLEPLNSMKIMKIRSHVSDPKGILSLTKAIYEYCPQAWWITVPGVNFAIGDRLSPLAKRGISQALTQIKALILDCQTDKQQSCKNTKLAPRKAEERKKRLIGIDA